MFFAFVRRKRCGSCLTVRAGREAKHEGCNWERKVEGQYSGNIVTLEAFERPEGLPPLPDGMHDAALHALFDDGFELVTYERVGNNPRQVHFTRKEGKILMSKVPDVNNALKSSGSSLKASKPAAQHDAAKNTLTIDLAALAALEPHVDQGKAAYDGITFWNDVAAGKAAVEGGVQIDLGHGRIFGGGIFKTK